MHVSPCTVYYGTLYHVRYGHCRSQGADKLKALVSLPSHLIIQELMRTTSVFSASKFFSVLAVYML
jgi:hypothetical protein